MQRINGLEQRFPPIVTTGADESWMEKAACINEDPNDFFPQRRVDRKYVSERAAAACGRCAVTAQCLEYAIKTGQTHGTWGGLSESEIARRTKIQSNMTTRSLNYGYRR